MPRTLVISDTHIGDPRYIDNQKVQNLLLTEDYDRLVLNGDIIDLWLSDINSIIKDPLYN
jgi:predicted phosphodiesterase